MKHAIEVILVQERFNEGKVLTYRIAKLIGAVFIYSKSNKHLHVGDRIDEAQASDLAGSKVYKVTVTEKGGKP